MDFEESIGALGALLDEVIATFPEAPAEDPAERLAELELVEAKAGELVARVTEHLALLDTLQDEPADGEEVEQGEDLEMDEEA